MINLMYLVFIAMMALNVSTEVLDGFELVEGSLRTSIDNSTRRNELVAKEMEDYYRQNPQKVGEWIEKSRQVKQASDSLCSYIQALKVRIVEEADGEGADVDNIDRKDDLEAASHIMLSPITGEGKKLREAIDQYRTWMGGFIQDSLKTAVMEASLSTTPPKKAGINTRSWEEALFENMPVAASVTLLTKLQSDIRYVEGEVLSNLLNNVDVGDYRVNQITAQVIPESQIVMRGSPYRANIVLSAVDSTKRPTIVVNGKELPAEANGLFTAGTGSVGTFPIKGFIEMPNADGSIMRREFESEYFVTEPSATIAPTMMNVLYAGIANPMRIAVPGVPSGNVTATMTNGTLTRSGDGWVAHPGKVGSEAVISVSAQLEGRTQSVGSMTFRVRKLPDPTVYLPVKDGSGNTVHYKGSPKRISKAALMSADGLGAAIDDDILNVTYQVVSFSTVFFDQMGNAIPEVSNGSQFSQRQKDQFRRLKAGKSFFISNVKAKGPDGITRDISPMEVALN